MAGRPVRRKIELTNCWSVARRRVKVFVDPDSDIIRQLDLIAVGATEPREVVHTIRELRMLSVMQFESRAT
jgi:hypothetical protein